MLLPSQSIFRMFKVLCLGMCNVLTHPTSKYSTYPLSSSLPYYYFPREYLLSEPIMLSKDIGLAFLQHKMSHLPFLLTKSTFSKKVHPFWSTLGPPFNELHQLMTNVCFEVLVFWSQNQPYFLEKKWCHQSFTGSRRECFMAGLIQVTLKSSNVSLVWSTALVLI